MALINLESKQGNLEGHLTGALDAAIIPFVTAAVSEASGEVELDYTLSGKISDPTFYGRAPACGH